MAAALGQALGAVTEETAALTLYQRRRDQELREIFEITCRLAAYPPVPAFIELQKQLSAAIDKQAAVLAARPARPGGCSPPPDRTPPARKEANRVPVTIEVETA